LRLPIYAKSFSITKLNNKLRTQQIEKQATPTETAADGAYDK